MTESLIILPNQKVVMTWGNKPAAHYLKLGYEKRVVGEEFLVDVDHLPSYSRALVLVQCPSCANIRQAKMQNVRKRNSSFCSPCATREGNALKIDGKRFGRLIARERLGKIDSNGSLFWLCVCDCGKEVEIPANRLSTGHTKSCGCLSLDLSRERVGPQSPAWNPNLTDAEREQNRDYREYYQWRFSVYERDNFTCQRCGKTKTRTLNAHHILSFSEHRELRTDIDNGITFCHPCHREFHRIYGNKGNNAKQIRIFLEKLA